IKVRDGSGGYLDWGATYGVLDGSSPWSSGNVGLLPPPPGLGTTSRSLYALLDNYRSLRRYASACKVERDRVEDLVDSLTRYVDRDANGLPQAEQQMLAWYKAADNKQVTEAQAESQVLLVKAR